MKTGSVGVHGNEENDGIPATGVAPRIAKNDRPIHNEEVGIVGFLAGDSVQRAADHLLHLLQDRNRIRYSETYYDGTDEQENRLVAEMGLDPNLGSWGPSPAILIDQAVWQLENIGWVEMDELDERLCDGEPDYVVELTSFGRKELRRGVRFEAHDQVL